MIDQHITNHTKTSKCLQEGSCDETAFIRDCKRQLENILKQINKEYEAK